MGLTREQKQLDRAFRLLRVHGGDDLGNFVRDHLHTLQTANEEFAMQCQSLREERSTLLERNTEMAEAAEQQAAKRDAAEKALKDAEARLTESGAKIQTLKEAARFYRAQRDRVDGYLSGVLDTRNALQDAMHGPLLDKDGKRVLPEPVNRPHVAEPFARYVDVGGQSNPDGVLDTGRHWASYRDQEPFVGWEEF